MRIKIRVPLISILTVSTFYLKPLQGFAQTRTPQEGETVVKIIDLFQKGGPVMYPILACSIIALAIILERFVNLRKTKIIPTDFLRRLRQHWYRGEAEMAITICEGYDVPISRVLKAGLVRHAHGFPEMEKAIEGAGAHEASLLSANLRMLGAVANIAPMFGFLGTVTGMIRAFNAIALHGTGNPGIVAGGIAEALITTAAGLFVGIPTLAFYHFFRGRVDRFIYEMEEIATELTEKVKLPQKGESNGGTPAL